MKMNGLYEQINLPRPAAKPVSAKANGTVNIGGNVYVYINSKLLYGGKQYVVSDDNDFVLTQDALPIGAIVNGTLYPIASLTAEQQLFFKNKYQLVN